MRSQRIGQGFESPYLHQIKDTAQGVLCFGGDNAGQHTARFAAQGALVCGKVANLMSRIKAFADILCLNSTFPIASPVVRANDPLISTKTRIRAHLAPILRCACLTGQALRIYAAKSRFRLLPA